MPLDRVERTSSSSPPPPPVEDTLHDPLEASVGTLAPDPLAKSEIPLQADQRPPIGLEQHARQIQDAHAVPEGTLGLFRAKRGEELAVTSSSFLTCVGLVLFAPQQDGSSLVGFVHINDLEDASRSEQIAAMAQAIGKEATGAIQTEVFSKKGAPNKDTNAVLEVLLPLLRKLELKPNVTVEGAQEEETKALSALARVSEKGELSVHTSHSREVDEVLTEKDELLRQRHPAFGDVEPGPELREKMTRCSMLKQREGQLEPSETEELRRLELEVFQALDELSPKGFLDVGDEPLK